MKSKLFAATAICLVTLLCLATSGFRYAEGFKVFKLSKSKNLKAFFKYTPDAVPFVSSHRGGFRQGFPENCIATFEHTLQHTHAMLEFDPHYTKDSAIVVMHDADLRRTSNGTGKIADHTLAEIKSYRLKDPTGALTPYQLPTLDEVLEWAKGKTIMVMDMKDVPIEARVRKIEEHHAENAAIVMAYTIADAVKCYKLNKNICMEVMLNSIDKLKEFDACGVPWENVVVFISQKPVTDRTLIDEIHKRGAMVIAGCSFTYDTDYLNGKITREELNRDHQEMLKIGVDIIETNTAIETADGIDAMQQAKLSHSSKAKFF